MEIINSDLSIDDVISKLKQHKWSVSVSGNCLIATRKYKIGTKRIDLEKTDNGWIINGILG